MNTNKSIVQEELTQQNKEFYHEHGYLIVPNNIAQEAVKQLLQEAVNIVSGKRGSIDGMLPKSTDLPESEEHKNELTNKSFQNILQMDICHKEEFVCFIKIKNI